MCSRKRRKEEKEFRKQHETVEEKRVRRLAKKAAKAEHKRESADIGGYTNEANPWNDSNLTNQFVWDKKVEKDRAAGVPDSASSAAQKRKRGELAVELEKVKHAREQRAAEKEAWEEERRLLDREREQMDFHEHEKREDEFQLGQTLLRAHIRVREGRAKPIDMLSESLGLLRSECTAEEAAALELQQPATIFEHLSERELTELRDDIVSHTALDQKNEEFWAAMGQLCDHNIQEVVRHQQQGGGVHDRVSDDVEHLLRAKNAAQLGELHEQITKQLCSGVEMDTDYWESVLAQLQLARARTRLSTMHQQLQSRRDELLGGRDASSSGERVTAQESAAPAATSTANGGDGRFSPLLIPEEEVDWEASDEEDVEASDAANGVSATSQTGASASAEENPGKYSPLLLSALQVNREDAIDEAEDFRQLLACRNRVKGRVMDTQQAPADGDKHLVDVEARKGMDAGEARFSFEIALEHKVAWWHDKYRPRKPKYFNRVHTGYEWNKYNQTHYDHDNPPPKMVQGYKFNVFYPDLIDRTQTPTYKLQADPSGAKDTCILRFHGGAPYEDIAFKLVNREWETSHKRGFRCRFERGILQLNFNFKRHRYRR